jgi:hypothetical protein
VLDRCSKHHAGQHARFGTPANDACFSFVAADGCDMRERFADRSFHIVHSNSVIEHVGDWRRMTAFAREVRRLAPAYFVQTPNFWFPVEPHFMTPVFHWLPEAVRVALVRRFALGHRNRQPEIGSAVEEVESVHLLNRKMFSFLFPDGRLVIERMLGLPKSSSRSADSTGIRDDSRSPRSRRF